MNEKYKALVYREWKIAKKFYVLRSILILLFVLLFGGIIVFSTRAGVKADGVWLFFLYLIVLFIAVAIGENNGVYKSDVNVGWLRFSWALPLTACEKAIAKYIFKCIVILSGTLFTLVSLGIICVLSEFTRMTTVVFAFFWCLDVCLLFDLLRHAIMMRAVDTKTLKKICKKASIVIFVIISIPDVITLIQGKSIFEKSPIESKIDAAIANSDFHMLADLMTIPKTWGFIGILLVFVLLIAGFAVTRKNYERRIA